MVKDETVLDIAMELPGARRYATYVAAICPFHEDSKPSLLVYPDWFRCTACGAQGRPERLWAQASLHSHLPDKKPNYYPYIPKGIEPEQLVHSANRILTQGIGLQDYLAERGLHHAIRRYNLGYWDGWYTIPTYSQEGKLNNVIFRAGSWVQKETGNRFYQLVRQKPAMYCPDWDLLESRNILYVVFGMMDAITLAIMGYAAVTPTTGKDSFNPIWLDFWHKPVVVIPDLGEEQEANRLAAKLDWRGHVLRLNYPVGAKDPNDYLYKCKDAGLLRREIDELDSRITNRSGTGT